MMAARMTPYRRLPGRARRLFGTSTLWYAYDHLLLVNQQSFSETYHRFYFRDIQSISTHRNDRGSVWWALLALASILVVVPAVAMFVAGAPWRWVWSVPAGVLLISLGVHWWRGTTCTCHMRTILQDVEIAPLRRVRWVRSALAIIEPLIEMSQGPFDRALLVEQVEVPGERGGDQAPPVRSIVPPPPPLPRGTARLQMVLCFLFLTDAAVTSGQILLPSKFFTALGAILALAEFGVVIAALTRQKSTLMGRSLRPFTWAAFGVLCLAAMTAWIANVVAAMNSAVEGTPVGTPVATAAPSEVYFVYVLVYVVVGIFGLTLIRRLQFESEHRWLNLKG
jgi:hypothetical protein